MEKQTPGSELERPVKIYFFLYPKERRENVYVLLIEAEVLVCHFLYINGNSSVSSATWLSPKMLHIDSIISVTES